MAKKVEIKKAKAEMKVEAAVKVAKPKAPKVPPVADNPVVAVGQLYRFNDAFDGAVQSLDPVTVVQYAVENGRQVEHIVTLTKFTAVPTTVEEIVARQRG